MNLQQHINGLIDKNRIDEALKYLDDHIEKYPEDPEGWYLRGKMRWGLDEKGHAMNDYARAAELDPDGPAKTALEHSRAIIDFFNPDLLNP